MKVKCIDASYCLPEQLKEGEIYDSPSDESELYYEIPATRVTGGWHSWRFQVIKDSLQPSTTSAQPGGMACSRCGNFNDYASPNQPDGTHKCFSCRR